MTCTKKALMVMMLTTLLGLWGCSQNNGAASAGNSRLRELEAKTARLEDDYKTVITARDQACMKITTLEDQRAQLVLQVEQLQQAVKERDELKLTLTHRTAERDAIQANLAQFGKDLQSLATKIDQAAREKAVSYQLSAFSQTGPDNDAANK